MTEKIRAAIKELRTRPWTAATDDMRELDDGYDAFVRTAMDKLHEPSMVVTASRHFKTLIPKGLHHSPAFVIWLPQELGQVAHALARVTPKASEYTSTDLRRRVLTLSWTCFGKSYIAQAGALKVSMEVQAAHGALPLVIASEKHTAISVLVLDDIFLAELSRVGGRCGENYCPELEHSPQELAAAMKRKWAHRRLVDEFMSQEPSDFDVLLRPRRAFRPDWIV
jgi:hypothetical protein